IAAFIPGASPPLVITAIRFIAAFSYSFDKIYKNYEIHVTARFYLVYPRDSKASYLIIMGKHANIVFSHDTFQFVNQGITDLRRKLKLQLNGLFRPFPNHAKAVLTRKSGHGGMHSFQAATVFIIVATGF